MKLLYPEFLWLLVPLSLLTWLRYRTVHKQRVLIHPKVMIGHQNSPFVRLAPFMALVWMLVALCRPVLLDKSVEKSPSFQTLYLAIDLSRSMQGTDRSPNRLAFAKEAIQQLVKKDQGHSFALLAFTTNTLILSPPTEDSALIVSALEALNPDFILTHGTSLMSLLEMVAKMAGDKKDLIIFSDGGDGEDFGALVQMAKANHIRIYSVACATQKGSKIPTDEGWLRDPSGRLVVSVLNPQLEALSLETGGVFIDADTPEEVANAIMRHVEMVREKTEHTEIRYKELFWFPLVLGILFFLAGTLSMGTIKQRLWLWLLPLIGLNAEAGIFDLYKLHEGYMAYQNQQFEEAKAIFASIDPPLLESTYALANSYYHLGAYKLAGRFYLKCQSSNPLIKQRIWYNLGNCAVKLGHYKSAKAYYIKALQIGFDEDVMKNLEMVLFLEEQKQKRVEAKANRSVKAVSQSGSADQTDERKDGTSSKSHGKMGEESGHSQTSQSTRIHPQSVPTEAVKRHPLGSKVYEMINKGYVHEEKPW